MKDRGFPVSRALLGERNWSAQSEVKTDKGKHQQCQRERRRMSAATPVCVAVVTGGRSVAVAVYIRMGLVGLGLLMGGLGVTVDTGKAGVIGGNLVAIIAYRLVMRDGEVGMVERGPKPGCRRVASVAGCWIPCRHMIRNAAAESLRAVPIGSMASIASRVCGCETVIVADMAEIARRRRMRARKSPTRRTVIECARFPRRRVVAGRAE